jgi:precorrin-6B C5,15-methyltransferase / cobalt-precorrin-6B C5,C15-methyltransferase
MTAPWLAIIGIGEDGILAPAAASLVRGAELVVGGKRHLALADALITGERLPWPSPIAGAFPAIVARRGRPVAVLASGDPYCHGVGTQLAALASAAETLCHPAPSAFALACARLGWTAQDVATVSFCGRPIETLAPLLQPGGRVLALSAGAGTPGAIAALLRDCGFGRSVLHVMEALGGPEERIRTATAAGFALDGIHPLNLIALDLAADADARVLPLASGLPDALFEHDGQLTRREIRAVTLSTLAPRRGEMLWDVGGGAGSIGIEWMLRHSANRAIAIEPHPDRAARIARNAARLGVPGLRVVPGAAPDALADLPPPDAVFLGGGAHRPGVIDTAWNALPPDGRIVANAVTIETEAVLLAAQARLGGTLLRLSVERMDVVGGLHAFRPAITVTQWSGVKT